MSEQQVIEQLKGGDELAFDRLYKQHRESFVSWAIKNMMCTEDEAKELYQISMIACFENATQDKLTELKSSFKTYLFGIGKNKIREMRRAKSRKIGYLLDFSLKVDSFESDDYLEYEEKMLAVEQGLQTIDTKCAELLTNFYFKRQSMAEITEDMAYKNAKTTKNMKYKCLGRLREVVSKILTTSQKTI